MAFQYFCVGTDCPYYSKLTLSRLIASVVRVTEFSRHAKVITAERGDVMEILELV